MPTAPVTAKGAALQGALWTPSGQAFQPSPDRVNPAPSMGAGDLSNAAWMAKMFPPAPQPLPHQQMQPQMQPQMQMQQPQMQPQMQQPPAPPRPARPEYQGQSYGGGNSYSKGNYGADRTTEPAVYNRLPGNNTPLADAAAATQNGASTGATAGGASTDADNVDWITQMNASDTTSEGWWINLTGVPGGGGRQWVPNPNYVDPNAAPEVPEGYESAEQYAQDANRDGTVSAEELRKWRPEDGRYGKGHGGQNLSQAGLEHLAKFGVVPTEGRDYITEQQFGDWAVANDAHGSEQYGRRAAWDDPEGRWDFDGNNIIDANELAKYQADLKQKAIAARMQSHNITEEKATADMDYMLAQGADINKDGTVTTAEWYDPKSVALREAAKKG